MPSVVTANRLTDGVVVYLAPDGVWTELKDAGDLGVGRPVVVEQREDKKQKRFGMF